MSNDTYERMMAEAKKLGAVLPCDWTPEQRDRVITLTGKTAAEIDEIILVSRAMNGRR